MMDLPGHNGDGHRVVDLDRLVHYHLDTMEIARGMSVEAQNGHVGVVDEIVFDVNSGRTSHFLVRKGDGLTRDALVPVEWVCQLEHNRILLVVRVEQVDAYADWPSEYSRSEDESPTA